MHHIHTIADWWFEDDRLLKTVEPARSLILRVADECGVRVLNEVWHQFEPTGYTGVLLLAESHISVHSWAAEKYLALDVFTCVDGASDKVIDRLREEFQPQREANDRHERGIMET